LVYQRMLAHDPVEAAEQAQTIRKEKPLVAYYDEVLVEGLKLAQADAERGLIGEEHMLRIRDAVAEIVDDLGVHEDRAAPPVEAEAEEPSPLAQITRAEESLGQPEQELPQQWRSGKAVLCIPGLGLLDEAVALIVAQLVERQGIGARAEQADALSVSRILGLDTNEVALICLCYVENATPAQIRHAIRRLRRKAPEAFILVTLVGDTTNSDGREDLAVAADIDFVKASLRTTVEKIFAVAAGSGTERSPSNLQPRMRGAVSV
jgi:hypothetical protein